MQDNINQTQGETPSPLNHTALLTGAAVVGGAALLAATPKIVRAQTTTLTFADIPGTGDIKVLNYALALEALEADLYAQAKAKLTALNVSSSDALVKYVDEFGIVERQHRDFLNSQLGPTNSILNSALKGATFNFGTNLDTAAGILDFLITVEATGVKAYLGAIPSFTVQSQYLPIAAAIEGTEARHTAALIVVKNRKTGSTTSPAPTYKENNGIDTFLSPDAVLAIVSPFIRFPAA